MTLNTPVLENQVSALNTTEKKVNRLAYHPQKQILDLGGSAALPFLRHILASDVAQLTAPGMGLQTRLRPGDADFDVSITVYYFSESAFRIIADTQHPQLFNAWLEQHEATYDIDIISRPDLGVMLIAGHDALAVLVEQFNFIPARRLSASDQRFGAQSGGVFVTTAPSEQGCGYELLASEDELARWQLELIHRGFCKH